MDIAISMPTERMTSVAQNSDTPSSVGIGAFHAIVPAIHPVGAPNSPCRAPAPPEGAWGEGPGRPKRRVTFGAGQSSWLPSSKTSQMRA